MGEEGGTDKTLKLYANEKVSTRNTALVLNAAETHTAACLPRTAPGSEALKAKSATKSQLTHRVHGGGLMTPL